MEIPKNIDYAKQRLNFVDIDVVKGLIRRVVPILETKLVLQIGTGEDEYFSLANSDDKIVVEANTTIAMCQGINHYLKNDCLTMISWFVDNPVEIPESLPLATEVNYTCELPDRFFLNYCTFAYTMPYWTWRDWERLIDWMALNGINMPLAITGQEAVWQRVWRQMGLNDDEILSFFTGPAYLPFQRMGIIDHWGGPLSQVYVDEQLALQQQILERQRSFSMRPVLPAFTGHIPAELKTYQPEVEMKQLASWNGFESECCTWFLNPESDYFGKIQSMFLKEQESLFGECHYYAADPFNELVPPSWEPEYLASVAKTIYETISTHDDSAVWVQMSWLFFHNTKMWTQPRIEAYLRAVPQGRLLMLDYYCENRELWRETEGFYGQDFIWCYLGNFGGQTKLLGPLNLIEERLNAAAADPKAKSMKGVGLTLEGLDGNPIVYDFILDKIWQKDRLNVADWTRGFARRRAGQVDAAVEEAWSVLQDRLYSRYTNQELFKSGFVRTRPTLEKRSCLWGDDSAEYGNSALYLAVQLLLQADESCLKQDRFCFDLVNHTREYLVNYFADLRRAVKEAYIYQNQNDFDQASSAFLELMKDLSHLLTSRLEFRLDSWINPAKAMSNLHDRPGYYERDARNIITRWGGKVNNELLDYANRDLAAMTLTYYLPRWESYFNHLSRAIACGEAMDMDALNEEMSDFEWNWIVEGCSTETAYADAVTEVKRLIDKYPAKPEPKYLLIDIGGTWIKGAVSTNPYVDNPYPSQKVKSPLAVDAKPTDLVKAIYELVDLLGTEAFESIAISTAGIVNYHGTAVTHCSPNLNPLSDSAWLDELKDHFSCPIVLVNDADAALIGVAEEGLIPAGKTVGLMVLGTGLGFSVVRNGRIWRPGGQYTLLGSMTMDGRSLDERASASRLASCAGGDLIAALSEDQYQAERDNYFVAIREAIALSKLAYQLDDVLLAGGLVDACNHAGFELIEVLGETAVPVTILSQGNSLQMIGCVALAHAEAAAVETRFSGDHRHISTEAAYDKLLPLHDMSSKALVSTFWKAEKEAAEALDDSATSVARCANAIVERLKKGGRIIYVGCGSSGRIAALDAVELGCTYGFPVENALTLISGGIADAAIDIEYNHEEDASVVPELLLLKPSIKDVVIGISASSTAYYVRSGLALAQQRGSLAILISERMPEKIFFDHHIAMASGPEVVCGSTRMKAGTATKKILNALTSTVMVRLGKVQGPYMIEVACINEKLQRRAATILHELFGLNDAQAKVMLEKHDYQLMAVIEQLRS